MEVERARLLSLASEFGFDEDAANQCLDRLLDLYGEAFRQTLDVHFPSVASISFLCPLKTQIPFLGCGGCSAH